MRFQVGASELQLLFARATLREVGVEVESGSDVFRARLADLASDLAMGARDP